MPRGYNLWKVLKYLVILELTFIAGIKTKTDHMYDSMCNLISP